MKPPLLDPLAHEKESPLPSDGPVPTRRASGGCGTKVAGPCHAAVTRDKTTGNLLSGWQLRIIDPVEPGVR